MVHAALPVHWLRQLLMPWQQAAAPHWPAQCLLRAQAAAARLLALAALQH